MEIPIADETNDNIVAFWTPEVFPDIKTPLALNYRLRFTRDEDKLQSQGIAYVSQTLRSTGEVKQSNLIREPDGSVAFLVDFVGSRLTGLDASASVASQVSIDDNGEMVENNIRYNTVTKGWRLTLRLKVKDNQKPVEIRSQ